MKSKLWILNDFSLEVAGMGLPVYFAPSHEEGWGIAVVEAMDAGLPTVAYNFSTYD